MSSTIPAVVFDCNIFLQAVLNPNGAAGACKQLVDRGQVELFVSPQVLAEVADVPHPSRNPAAYACTHAARDRGFSARHQGESNYSREIKRK